tara:strand:+ start:163 stop:651 length:489 start_codon:yes stop_codon:yes gene_type:complete
MKKLMNSKKAISAKVFYWIFVLMILLPVMIFSIIQVINAYSANITKIGNLGNILIEDRVMNILAFTDPNTGRVFHGIIYLPNFNETFINKALKTQRKFGLKLTLEGKQIYFNKEFYDVAEPIKDLNKYKETKLTKYVLIKEKSKNAYPSFMNISIMHYREYE